MLHEVDGRPWRLWRINSFANRTCVGVQERLDNLWHPADRSGNVAGYRMLVSEGRFVAGPILGGLQDVYARAA
jgi:hypothetical protein